MAYGSGLHLLAYAETGELFTWGYNTYSQLGNGTTNHTLIPSIVGGVLAGKSILQVGAFISFLFVSSCYGELTYYIVFNVNCMVF